MRDVHWFVGLARRNLGLSQGDCIITFQKSQPSGISALSQHHLTLRAAARTHTMHNIQCTAAQFYGQIEIAGRLDDLRVGACRPTTALRPAAKNRRALCGPLY